jgi:hypothetical protein
MTRPDLADMARPTAAPDLSVTPDLFSVALDRLCEAYEACGLEREDIIPELEMKVSELRGEVHDPVAVMPLP